MATPENADHSRIRHESYNRMRRFILVIMILVPFIPFILILAIGYYHFTASIETSTIASMKRIVGDHHQMIDSFLKEREADLEFVLHGYTYEDLSRSEKLGEVFRLLQRKSGAFLDLGIFDAFGIHVSYQGPFELQYKVYREADWFKKVMEQGYYISDVFLGYRQIPHFVIAVSRQDQGKKWAVRATIDSLMFNDLVKRVRIGSTGEAYILNTEGVLQTDRRSGGNLMEKPGESLEYPQQEYGIHTFIGTDGAGEKYLYATTWLKDKRWLLVVRQAKSDAFKSLRTAAYMIFLIAVVGGAAIFGTAIYLTGRIVNRMESMDAEKDQLGYQLIRASRLAELGEMSTGFAHEINNPLQIIQSEQALIEAILSELKENGELKASESLTEMEDSLNQIQVQIGRAAQITQSILKFGRKSEPMIKEVDLAGFIPEVADMVAKKASVHGIAIRRNMAEGLPAIQGDPAQLQQVLLNLFNNAIDAILEKCGTSGGELSIETACGQDGFVEIRVIDNGCGISPENLKRIFTPFFTTKPVGKGTGLGLSVCYGIVDSMGGVMEVESRKGVGTRFIIKLPAL